MKDFQNTGIKVIAFDYYGVIQFLGNGDLPGEIANIIGISRENLQSRYFELNHLTNVENISWVDVMLTVVAHFTDSQELKTKVLKTIVNFQSHRELNNELLSFLPKIKNQGYKTAILSNATSELRKELQKLNIDILFDEIVISGEIGFQKPNKEAFEELFKNFKVLPQEVLFIDDSEKSLAKASEIGYIPLLFRNNEKLMIDLKGLGVTI